MVDLSIVIPCYNEEKNIPIFVKRFDTNRPKGLKYELRLVDNGSSDGTQKAIRELMKRHSYITLSIVKKNQGYGYGILSGLKDAKGKYVCWTHADIQTDILDTIKAYDILMKSKDPEHTFVKGKRVKRAFLDAALSFFNEAIVTLILGKPMHELNAQPNLFHKDLLKGTRPPKDWSIEVYTYYLAKKKGYDIKRFPVLFTERKHGESKWNTGLAAKINYIRRAVAYTWKLRKQKL